MTSSQIPSPSNFVRPFASGQNLSGVTIDNALSPTGQLSYVNGFGYAFSTPGSNGGRYVKRMEMNKLFNVSTNDVFRWKVGAINTFDATFAATIGGYPEGAILDFLDGKRYNKVISLHDNNTANFIANGVDGVDWAYIGSQEIDDGNIILEIADFDLTKTGTADLTWIQVATFRAAKSGFLVANGTYSLSGVVDESVDSSSSTEDQTTTANTAFCIVAIEADSASAIGNINPASPAEGLTKAMIMSWGGNNKGPSAYSNVTNMTVTAGKYYSVWIAATLCKVYDSTLKVRIM